MVPSATASVDLFAFGFVRRPTAQRAAPTSTVIRWRVTGPLEANAACAMQRPLVAVPFLEWFSFGLCRVETVRPITFRYRPVELHFYRVSRETALRERRRPLHRR